MHVPSSGGLVDHARAVFKHLVCRGHPLGQRCIGKGCCGGLCLCLLPAPLLNSLHRHAHHVCWSTCACATQIWHQETNRYGIAKVTNKRISPFHLRQPTHFNAEQPLNPRKQLPLKQLRKQLPLFPPRTVLQARRLHRRVEPLRTLLHEGVPLFVCVCQLLDELCLLCRGSPGASGCVGALRLWRVCVAMGCAGCWDSRRRR